MDTVENTHYKLSISSKLAVIILALTIIFVQGQYILKQIDRFDDRPNELVIWNNKQLTMHRIELPGFVNTEKSLKTKQKIPKNLEPPVVINRVMTTIPTETTSSQKSANSINSTKTDMKNIDNIAFKNLELMVVTNYKFKNWWNQALKRTLELFWPAKDLKLVVITEKPENNEKSASDFIKSIKELKYARTVFENYMPDDVYHNSGHSKQQLIMFEADKYTKSKFIGFVDTDSVFVVPVIPSAIFKNGKPVVKGIRGRPISSWWNSVPWNTEKVLGFPEIGCFMTYFPVVVESVHLKELRNYLEKLHGKKFHELFKWFSKDNGNYSQFNIIMNYSGFKNFGQTT